MHLLDDQLVVDALERYGLGGLLPPQIYRWQ